MLVLLHYQGTMYRWQNTDSQCEYKAADMPKMDVGYPLCQIHFKAHSDTLADR